MKKTLVLLALTCTSFAGCQSNQVADTITATESVIAIAKDQSQSVKADFATTTVQQKLHYYLEEHCTEPNDLLLTHVHSYSNAATNHQLISWKPYKDAPGANDDKEMEAFQKKSWAKQQIKKMEQQIFSFVTDNNNGETYNETVILELLPKLYEQTNRYKQVQLLFLSDMIQESPLVNFTKRRFPFSSKQVAVETAGQDAQLLQQQFHLPDNAFDHVTSITVFVPANAPQNKLVFMDDYWGALFEKFGYKGAISWKSL
jgi:hypothetical protein